jgi:hypothetical protein
LIRIIDQAAQVDADGTVVVHAELGILSRWYRHDLDVDRGDVRLRFAVVDVVAEAVVAKPAVLRYVGVAAVLIALQAAMAWAIDNMCREGLIIWIAGFGVSSVNI